MVIKPLTLINTSYQKLLSLGLSFWLVFISKYSVMHCVIIHGITVCILLIILNSNIHLWRNLSYAKMLEAHKPFIVIPWEIHHSPAFPTSLPSHMQIRMHTHICAHFFNTYADRHSSTWGIFAFLLWYNLLYFVHPLIIFGKVSRSLVKDFFFHLLYINILSVFYMTFTNTGGHYCFQGHGGSIVAVAFEFVFLKSAFYFLW